MASGQSEKRSSPTRELDLTVAHIADSTGGGANCATRRLHRSLQRIGVDSRLLLDATIKTRCDSDPLLSEAKAAVLRHYVERNRTPVTNTHFSLYIDGADVSGLPHVQSSDIVHLHWTASFQTPDDVLALLQIKPVVWTLHDLGPLTGGCHFSAGCTKFAGDCDGCPQLISDPFRVTATTLRDKRNAWTGRQITFIAPSRYIEALARKSSVAQESGASIQYLPNGIDVDAYHPLSKAIARSRLGLPSEGTYVLCGSLYNGERRKGLHLVERVLGATAARLNASEPLNLLTVGDPQIDTGTSDGIRVFQFGRVTDEIMASLYAAADVFLLPSLEDNSPCMLLESLSCGTPVVAFDVGGISEVLRDDACGRIVPPGDHVAMAAALSALLSDPGRLQQMSDIAREHIVQHFSDVASARAHANLYEAVREDRAACAAVTHRAGKSEMEKIFPSLSVACLVRELAEEREQSAHLREDWRQQSEHLALLKHNIVEGNAKAVALEGAIASLKADVATLAGHLADHHRQLQQKEAELSAVRAVAAERDTLTQDLHAAAEHLRSLAMNLQTELAEQRVEIQLVHKAAADRQTLIETFHRQEQQRADQSAEIDLIHQVAAERGNLIEDLQATIDEQRAEIDLIHRIAAERQNLIERLHSSLQLPSTGVRRRLLFFRKARRDRHGA
jgi:glycosyltransferase involved in cell wall biosynthesis